ncbi:MAG TPA: ankyrin repeat domain-containing protein [Gammaproteobacteria bacterium]|jgi:ankyrin repeat protein|nr:ankyrin repeat domain-containing protein [Gammaproteobacteria bacterium]
MRACLATLTIAALAVACVQPARAGDLVAAAERNDRAEVLAELGNGADARSRSADGTTALHWAVFHDDTDLVARLVKAGADVNAANDYGSTPLGEAAVTGNAVVVKRLLEAGASVNAPGKDGETPLMVLARGSHVEAARLLIEHGADVNAQETWRGQTALIWAAAQKQPAMVRLLLAHGANPNARSKVPEWDRQVSAERRRQYRPFGGLTALMYAAREGCVECARALVEGGADPDLPGYRGITPLIMAIDNLNFDTAAYLLDAGASLDVWDWWGRTPLYMAVDMNTLPHGGRPDRASTDKTTSLQLIERMLAKGASPDSQLKLLPPYRERGADRGCDSLLVTGTTPLLRAAKTFDVPAMQLLIAHGARLDLPNSSGVTPFMAAAGYGSLECDIRGYGPGIPHYMTTDVQAKSISALQVLLDAGADVNGVTTGGARGKGPGQTALFGAAFWGWTDVVKFLAAHGAKLDMKDADGRTAVDAALGRAGGHERGASIKVFKETAETLLRLCGQQEGCRIVPPIAPSS